MNKNKKEYLKPSVLVVLLNTHGYLLTSPGIRTYDYNYEELEIGDEEDEINIDKKKPYEIFSEEEIL